MPTGVEGPIYCVGDAVRLIKMVNAPFGAHWRGVEAITGAIPSNSGVEF